MVFFLWNHIHSKCMLQSISNSLNKYIKDRIFPFQSDVLMWHDLFEYGCGGSWTNHLLHLGRFLCMLDVTHYAAEVFHTPCHFGVFIQHHGLYSPSLRTSYCQISWGLEAARLDIIMIVLVWNLTGISTALLPRFLSIFKAIGKV